MENAGWYVEVHARVALSGLEEQHAVSSAALLGAVLVQILADGVEQGPVVVHGQSVGGAVHAQRDIASDRVGHRFPLAFGGANKICYGINSISRQRE
ncbi:hypothetical protein [Paractinoplanes hotanensis]|uniref:Uncharacterized protein n=1 Tax=Paractinoplanes hotanensis TaxID=2906497 RepID=A0ABT0YBM0_9ACTN|nr:hypothetical protein [Actinoplanes hotanensis]MCM4083441.1 hypothetical protein [Actinoplanes hotanensis]